MRMELARESDIARLRRLYADRNDLARVYSTRPKPGHYVRGLVRQAVRAMRVPA